LFVGIRLISIIYMRSRSLKLFFLFLGFCATVASAQIQECDSADCQQQRNTGSPLQMDMGNVNLQRPTSVGGDIGEGQQLPQQGQRVVDLPSPTEAPRQENQALTCPGPQCPPLPEEPKTEFQKFVFTTTGEKLAIYGRNLFETSPSTFAPVDKVPVPADYVVGPGDELRVRLWGQVNLNARVSVDRNGQIYLPRVGAVNVTGIRYDELTGYLKNEVGRVFKNFDLNVTMGQLRSIQILVVGQARRPGTYTVSSLSTLVTALFASGGPNSHGSMRHIQLKRQQKVVAEFDLYDLLSSGDKSKDSALLPGDVIYIPAMGKQVAVMGSVNLPGIYEITDNTSIRDQIAISGGLSTTADGTRVIVERIDNRSTRNVEEMKLNDAGLTRKLQDGDMIRIFPISPKIDGSIVLRGSVAVPGRFPWHEGMRVSDLISTKDAIVTREYWMRQTLLSRSEMGWANPQPAKASAGLEGNQQQEQNFDPSLDPGELSRKEPEYGTGSGPAYDPNRQAAQPGQPGAPNQGNGVVAEQGRDDGWSDGRITSDHTRVIRNAAEINWDYAVIQRMNPQDLTSELHPFHLARAIEDPASEDNLELKAGDVITIFSQADLAVPAEKRTRFVWVEGEVKSAGVYRVKSGETLRDLVNRAGGLTSSAYLFGAEFRRLSTRSRQQFELNKFIENMENDLRSKTRLLSASLNPEDRVAGQQEVQAQQQSIARLRQVQPTGRIVLELKPTDSAVTDLPAVAMEDGDRLIIPARPATVGVVGAVYNQNSFLFENNSSVGKYLRYAGGGTRDADKGRAFIVRANGSVLSKQMYSSMWSGGFDGLRLYPGDAIVMPEKLKSSNVLKGLRDWTQVFAQLALGAAVFKTLSP
jgi:polysaccharide biosynthesis/export protein